MNKQQAEKFIAIYNMLLTISTKGEDTKIMARVLEEMENLANSVQVIEEPSYVESEELTYEPVMEGE